MQFGVILLSSLLACAPAQKPPSEQSVWSDFLQWYRNNPQWDPQDPYRDKLRKDGVPEAEATRRAALVGKLATQRPEALSIFFDFVFTQEKPSFRTDPNALLVETVKDSEARPGAGCGYGAGSQRHLARRARLGRDGIRYLRRGNRGCADGRGEEASEDHRPVSPPGKHSISARRSGT